MYFNPASTATLVRRMKLSHTATNACVHKNPKIYAVNSIIGAVQRSIVGTEVHLSLSLVYLSTRECILISQALAIVLQKEIRTVLAQLARKVVGARRRRIIVSISPVKTEVFVVQYRVLAHVLVLVIVILVFSAKQRPATPESIRYVPSWSSVLLCCFFLPLSCLSSLWTFWNTASALIQLGKNSSVFNARNERKAESQRFNEWPTFMYQQRIHPPKHKSSFSCCIFVCA